MEGLLRSRQPSSAGSLNESAARRPRRLLLGGLVCESFVDLADLYRDKFKSARDAGLRGSIGIEGGLVSDGWNGSCVTAGNPHGKFSPLIFCIDLGGSSRPEGCHRRPLSERCGSLFTTLPSSKRAALKHRPMPTFIPAGGRTLHVAGVCITENAKIVERADNAGVASRPLSTAPSRLSQIDCNRRRSDTKMGRLVGGDFVF
jgi:hypothetical protein